MSINQPIYKGDDTGAFGNQFITITIKNPHLYQISKLEVVTNSGCTIPNKIFIDENEGYFQRENIVLNINYSSEETSKLNATNTVKVVPYDINGLHTTCSQTLVFYAQNGVISRNAECGC